MLMYIVIHESIYVIESIDSDVEEHSENVSHGVKITFIVDV